MHMFTWHEAYTNRSNQIRLGLYSKYMAADSPPGCGPYLFSDSNAAIFKERGRDLLRYHSDGMIASTRLLLECADRILFLQTEDGLWSLPGGAAQRERKVPGTDDDNVIEFLLVHLKEQLGIELPWVSYVGDFNVGENDDLCRIYAYPGTDRPELRVACPDKVAWLDEREISQKAKSGKLLLGFEGDAVHRWLHESLLRGIGQARSQVGMEDVKLVSTAARR